MAQTGRGENPALRPARRVAGWPTSRGCAARCQRAAALRILVLNRLRRMDRDELLTAVYGEDAPPDHNPRLSVLLSKLRRVVGPELLSGRSEIELVLPRMPSSTSRRRSRHCTGRSPTSPTASGRRPGARPASPITSPAVPCSRARTACGWTSGAVALTTFGCTDSSASQRRGSASAARRCRRPRSAGAGSIELAPYRETGYRILMEALEQPATTRRRCSSTTACASCSAMSSGSRPSPAVQSVYRRLLGETTTTTP